MAHGTIGLVLGFWFGLAAGWFWFRFWPFAWRGLELRPVVEVPNMREVRREVRRVKREARRDRLAASR